MTVSGEATQNGEPRAVSPPSRFDYHIITNGFGHDQILTIRRANTKLLVFKKPPSFLPQRFEPRLGNHSQAGLELQEHL